MKIGEIPSWEAFLGVATYGNFSEAARQLRAPLSQISKRVAKLESDLGVRLFQRTTRVVTLTDEGRALLPKIQSILEDLRETESLFDDRRPISGTVKITAVPFVAHNLLLPHLAEFTALHPGIHLDLELSENFLNLIEGGFDMAIRIETPKDSDLVYRKLAPNDLIFCASPKYLKRNPAPLTSPRDLNHHALLILNIHRKCRFTKQSVSLGEIGRGSKISCQNGAFLTEMAIQGFGVLVRSIWDVQRHLKEGTLVQVLKKHPLETFGFIHAVVPNRRFLAPRVRILLDYLVAKSKGWKKSSSSPFARVGHFGGD